MSYPCTRAAAPRIPRRVAHALTIVAVSLLAACRDATPTAPSADPAGDALRASVRTSPSEQLVVTRTIELEVRERGRAARTVRQQKVSHFTRRVGSIVRGTGVPANPPRGARGIEELPPVALTVPAAEEIAGAATPYRRREPVAGEPGVEVEVEGVGSAPPAVLRYFRDGTLTTTVTQQYVRRGGSWALVRRETRSAFAHSVNVVEVRWLGPPLDAMRRVDPQLFRPASLGLAASAGSLAALMQQQSCDPCKAQREAAESALVKYYWTEAAAVVACALTPPPADLLACLYASLKVVEAWNDYTAKLAAWRACLDTPYQCPAKTIISKPGGTFESDMQETCYYEVLYWLDTGEVISVQLLYCQEQPMMT